MAAFDDCTAAVDAAQGAKVAADMQAREISQQKFHDALVEKRGAYADFGNRLTVARCPIDSRCYYMPFATDRALAQRMANDLRR